MKTSHISVTLFLALVVFVNANPNHRLPSQVQAAFDACLKKLNLSAERLHELDGSEESSKEDDDLSCFDACVDKELGLMNAEGNYDREALLKEFPPHVSQEQRTNIVDTCLEQKGTDECETAMLYHSCLKKTYPHPNECPESRKMHEDCKVKLNMTDEEVKKIIHSKEELKTDCFRACIMKGFGFLNQDGTFNKEVLFEKTPAFATKMTQKFVDNCAEEVGADDCETAALMHKCFKNNDIIVGDFSGAPPRE